MSKDLTVVLAVGARRDRAVGCLASVLAQEPSDRLEVLLFELAPGDPPPLPGSDHPSVRILRRPPDTLFSAAKAEAVRLASSPVVAFIEEHVRVHPGWAAALIEAHRGPWAGVGPEVHNGNPGIALSRTIQLINYHSWMPPAPRAEFGMLPGHNSSFKRDVLLSYGDGLQDLLRAEVLLHLRLHRDGHRLLLEPAAKIEHINESTLESAARGRFLWNRIYAPLRARAFGWSRTRRLAYVLGMPLVPFYSLARLFLFLARRRPELLPRAVAGSPALFMAQLAAGAGQSLGLLFGTGDAEARFSLYEMNEYRALGTDGG
jgi:GT2 family glycosyltransferase